MKAKTYRHQTQILDDKNRLVLPADLRSVLGQRVLLRAATHGQIYLCDPGDDKYLRQELGPHALDAVFETILDDAGRIMLPDAFVAHLFQGKPDASRSVTLRRTSWFDTGDYVLLWTDVASGDCMSRVYASRGLGKTNRDILASTEWHQERDRLLALMEDSLSLVPRIEVEELAAEYVQALMDWLRVRPGALEKLWPTLESRSEREALAWQMYIIALLTQEPAAAQRTLGRINELLGKRQWHAEVFLDLCAGHLEHAIQKAQTLGESEPENYLLQYHLCDLSIREGRFDDALLHLMRVVSQRPEALPHLLRSDHIAQTYGIATGMARYAAEVVAYRGRPLTGQAGVKDAWIPRSVYQQAVSHAREHPDSARIQSDTGNYLMELGLFHEACRYLGAAVRLSPDDPVATTDQLCALIGCGQWEEAHGVIETRLHVAKVTEMATAIACNALGRKTEARQALQVIHDNYVDGQTVTNPVAVVVLKNWLNDISIVQQDKENATRCV